jgi:hypothetical protein
VNELKGKKNNSKLTRPAKLLHLIKKSEIRVLKKEKSLILFGKHNNADEKSETNFSKSCSAEPGPIICQIWSRNNQEKKGGGLGSNSSETHQVRGQRSGFKKIIFQNGEKQFFKSQFRLTVFSLILSILQPPVILAHIVHH